MYDILNKVNSPKDLKNLKVDELEILAQDIRDAVINKVSKVGGHVGPNLGIVEATIALHYVFDFSKDKIVWDVSHQCYPHKILTGRKDGFINDDKLSTVSGYLSPEESNFDTFKIGHTSTSISLATGIAKARDMLGKNFNVVSVIGDGSLSGGEAFEGFNNASVLGSNFIVVVNDNEMSIAENQGGLYKNLRELRQTQGTSKNNFFKIFGFDYIYVEEGNNIQKLIETFNGVKDFKKPIVIHIHTLKGKGLDYAETKKERWHFSAPFEIESGELKNKPSLTTSDAIRNYLLNKAKLTKNLAVVTAATPGLFGFNEDFRNALGRQFIDVGIAEEHAIAVGSALAKNGIKPVLAFNSSFIQRTYDQLSQELALNKSPAVILVYKSGISAASSTHLGVFDLQVTNNIPNIVNISPTNAKELVSVLEWAIEQNEHPVVIRVPMENIEELSPVEDFDGLIGRFRVEKTEKDVALLGVGVFFNLAKKVKIKLKEKYNISATLINPLYTSNLDYELLEKLKENHTVVATFENAVLDGGFGEKISRFYGDSDMKVLNFGASKEFPDNVSIDTLKERNHLTSDLAAEDISKIFNQ